MYGRIVITDRDLGEMLPIFFGILVAVFVIVLIVYIIVRNQDNGRPLVTQKVTVIEKPIQQGNIEWYVLECENGIRLRLRSFHAKGVILSVGDKGTVTYRGRTIQSFNRE